MHLNEVEISLTFHDRQRKFFADAAEKGAYVEFETRRCVKQYKDYCAAVDIKERKKALLILNDARLECYDQWTKRHIQRPKEVV